VSLARNPLTWSGLVVIALAITGACVDFVPAYRLADPKIAWACLGIAVLVALRVLVSGRGAQVDWLRRRRPVARWVGVLVLPLLLAPLLWLVFVRALPWAWTRAAGFPAQWHLPVYVAQGTMPACATTISNYRFHAWPHTLCLPEGAGKVVPGDLARAELTGHRSVVGFAVSGIRVRTGADAAAPEVESAYDPAIEVER
jgi:hypothetical protein